MLHALEARRLLSGGNPLSWDLLGTESGDHITISLRESDQRLLATMNGQVVATRLLRNTQVIELSGLGGNDVIVIDLHDPAKTPGVWINGGTGRDVIIGSPGDDLLIGGSGRDVLDGGKGDDALRGGTDRDELIGGDGNDYCQGNAGNDTIAGGWGDDTLTGGAGADQLRGGDDGDILVGGKDADTLKGGLHVDDLQPGGGANVVFRQLNIDQTSSGSLDIIADDEPDESLSRLESENELRQWLIERAVEQWKWAFGQVISPLPHWQWYRGELLVGTTGQITSFANSLDAAAAPTPDASTTNTQEQGVDEADLVETDGEYLYLLDGNDLVIADARPADQLKVISRTAIEGNPIGIYLDAARVTVVSQIGGYTNILYGHNGGVVATDAFAPEPAADPQVQVTVFDVADPTDPAVVETTAVDGWLNDSRMIDGRLYLVVQNYLAAPAPETSTIGEDQVYESEASYRARLEAGDWRDMIPGYSAQIGDNGAQTTGDIIAAPDVYVRAGQQLDTASVVLINTRDASAGPTSSTSVIGANGQIYASPDSLYLSWHEGTYLTNLIKFGLGVDQVTLEAAGKVDGITMDAFSMSEHGEFFRIATMTASGSGPTSSGVTVFDQIGDDLTAVGVIDGLGEQERITAVRFRGERAYLVTFLQIDPLFVLDLSEPTAPALKGELKIPGFSEYLHPVGENHLIGLGWDADQDGMRTTLQVSLFDVSDPSNPVRVDAFNFPEGLDTPALWDYHSFSFFPEQGVLAIPASNAGNTVEVLKIDLADGITRLGAVQHEDVVQRSVRIGNDLYTVGLDAIRVHSLDDLDDEIASAEL